MNSSTKRGWEVSRILVAIHPDIKKTFPNATIEIVKRTNLMKAFSEENSIFDDFSTCARGLQIEHKTATFVSNFNESSLTFFNLKNTKYRTFTIRNKRDLNKLIAFQQGLFRLIDRHEMLEEFITIDSMAVSGCDALISDFDQEIVEQSVDCLNYLFDIGAKCMDELRRHFERLYNFK